MIEIAMMAAGIGAVYAILYWSIRNEGVRRIEEQQGFLSMLAPKDPNAEAAPSVADGHGGRARRGRRPRRAAVPRRPGSAERRRR